MQKRIKYFSFYGCVTEWQKRDSSPAADTKMDYIIDVINRCGVSVDVVSLATCPDFNPSKGFKINKGSNSYKFFPCLGKSKIRIIRYSDLILRNIQLLCWCLFNLQKYEQIIVYHSLGYDKLFILLKQILNIRIIGDIEEIYQDVHNFSTTTRKDEYRFIDICDKYMFPNHVLTQKMCKNKPYLVCHGIYKVSSPSVKKINDGLIHLLYSGTYDPQKGGALAAVKAAEYLPEIYHLHITGFGDSTIVCSEINRLKSKGYSNITFHGYLPNDEFVKLMQSCHIGLCTQNPVSKLNLSSFPSKILNYISNGLMVLSGHNEAIDSSSVSDIIYYYAYQTPEAIAKAISEINVLDPEVGYNRLRVLDQKLLNSFINLFELRN